MKLITITFEVDEETNGEGLAQYVTRNHQQVAGYTNVSEVPLKKFHIAELESAYELLGIDDDYIEAPSKFLLVKEVGGPNAAEPEYIGDLTLSGYQFELWKIDAATRTCYFVLREADDD